MATWVGKITLSCPKGVVVRKLTGTPAEVVKRATSYDASKAGAGCSVRAIQIVKRGIGAGARDRYEGESPFDGSRRRKRGMAGAPGWWPFGHKKAPAAAKRGAMTRTVYMMKTKSGSYIPVDRPPSRMVQASSDAAYISGARKRGRKRRR